MKSLADEQVVHSHDPNFIVYNDLNIEPSSATTYKLNDDMSTKFSIDSMIATRNDLNTLLEETTIDMVNFESTIQDYIPIGNIEFENYRETLLKDESMINYELNRSNNNHLHTGYYNDLNTYRIKYDNMSSEVNEKQNDDNTHYIQNDDLLKFEEDNILNNERYTHDISYINIHPIINEKLRLFINKHQYTDNIGYFTAINSDRKKYIYIGTNTGKIIYIKYTVHGDNSMIDVHRIQILFDKEYEMSITSISCQNTTLNSTSCDKGFDDDELSLHSYGERSSSHGSFIDAHSNKITNLPTTTSNNYNKIFNLFHKKVSNSPHYIFVLYENRIVLLWNIITRKVIAILDYQQSQNTVINQIIMHDKYSLYLNENSGNGYYVKFTKNYKLFRKTLIYSSNLQHVQVVPLYFNSDHLKCIEYDPCIVAISTSTNVFIMSLWPEKINLFTHNLLEYYINNYGNINHNIDLLTMNVKWYIKDLSSIILACVSNVAIFIVYFEYINGFNFKHISVLPVKHTICFEWVSHESFLRIDCNEDLNVGTYNTIWSERKICSLNGVQLSQNFKYSPYGINYMTNAITCIAPDFYTILGLDTILGFSINNDSLRLEYFIKKNQFINALFMIKHIIHKYKYSHQELKNDTLHQKISMCLEKYIHTTLEYIRVISNSTPFFYTFLKILWFITMYFCTMKEFKSICFSLVMTTIYQDLLSGTKEKNSFLDVVLHLVVKQKKINHVPSLLFDDMKSYLMVTMRISKFESFIMNLEQFHIKYDDPIFTILINHSMYHAYFYLYNKGLNEFISPLHKLMNMIRHNDNESCSKLSIDQINAILEAIIENINENIISLSNQTNDDQNNKRFKDTCDFMLFKESNVQSRRSQFEILRILIKYRLSILLDILTIGFSQSQQLIGKSNYKLLVHVKNQIINAIANVMISCDEFDNNDKSLFYLFIGREIIYNPNTILLNKAIFGQLFDYLTIPNLDRTTDKEHILLKLFELNYFIDLDNNTTNMEGDHTNESKNTFYSLHVTISMLEKCRYYRILGFIYGKTHQFDQLIKLYLFLLDNHIVDFNVCDHLKSLIISENIHLNNGVNNLQNSLSKNLKSFVNNIDATSMFLFITEYFPSLVDDFLLLYKNDDIIYYNLLTSLFMKFDGQNNITVGDLLHDVYHVQFDFIDCACYHENEQFIVNYLQNYKIYVKYEKLIPLFRKHNFMKCLIYIYTNMGNYDDICHIHRNIIINKLSQLMLLLDELNMVDYYIEWNNNINIMNDHLKEFFHFFSTKFHLFSSDFTWSMWCDILEHGLSLYVNSGSKRRHTEQQKLIQSIGNICITIFDNMTKYVSIFQILHRILQKQSLYQSIIPKLNVMFTNMSDQKTQDKIRFQLSNNIAASELMVSYRRFIQISRNAFVCNSNNCNICIKTYLSDHIPLFDNITQEKQRFILFNCGHWEHKLCRQRLSLNSAKNTNYYCSQCFVTSTNIPSFKIDNICQPLSTISIDNITKSYSDTSPNNHYYCFENTIEELRLKNKNIHTMYNNFIE